jgi:mannose-6-phosphate isomerase-like protein (cupin superfamily)
MTNEVRRLPTLTLSASGEHFEFLTSAHSGDGIFRFRWTLAPGKKGPPPHSHPSETESFRIVSGRLRMWRDGDPTEHGPGDEVQVAPRVIHRFHNPGPDPVVADVWLDGPLQEDALVPMALHLNGRTRPTPSEILRQIVHQVELGAISTGHRSADASARLFARVLRRFGVRGFPSMAGWDVPG